MLTAVTLVDLKKLKLPVRQPWIQNWSTRLWAWNQELLVGSDTATDDLPCKSGPCTVLEGKATDQQYVSLEARLAQSQIPRPLLLKRTESRRRWLGRSKSVSVGHNNLSILFWHLIFLRLMGIVIISYFPVWQGEISNSHFVIRFQILNGRKIWLFLSVNRLSCAVSYFERTLVLTSAS